MDQNMVMRQLTEIVLNGLRKRMPCDISVTPEHPHG